jgi:autotransporter-associated beta strand protein
LRLCVGGQDEFTGEQASRLLNNLTAGIDNNGLMGGSFFSIDTAHAAEPVTMSSNLADSQGPGGGWFFFQKAGAGALQLTGVNTYTGQTFLEGGTLIVCSLNRVAGGRPSSSLGAPTTPEAGTIEMAADCGLTYTGTGEATDRILDLTGCQPQTVTLDQSGSGLLKFTSDIVYSGYGHSKTIVLKGSTAGMGEIVGRIANPYDRQGAATTAVIKTGTGTWTLSGDNRYTGPTTVTQGTLVLTSTRSLGANAEISIADGAQLDLRFQGELQVRKLTLGGVVQPAGVYHAANASKFLKGTGVLKDY